MSQEYPKIFARFYDLIYSKLRDGVDNQYFLNKIKNTKGKVLEVGVGTGRFYIDALNAGADIYGIDISPEMINVLKNKLDKKYHYRVSVQSMQNFKLDNTFDLIIAPFRVFSHITEVKEQIESLNHVYNYLNPGGTFIFDLFVPDLSQILNGLNNVVDFDEEYEPGKRCKRTINTNPDLITQNLNLEFLFEWDDDKGTKKEKWKVPFRIYFRYELEHLVERSKFTNYKIYGDYKGNELNSKSKEFVMVCEK